MALDKDDLADLKDMLADLEGKDDELKSRERSFVANTRFKLDRYGTNALLSDEQREYLNKLHQIHCSDL